MRNAAAGPFPEIDLCRAMRVLGENLLRLTVAMMLAIAVGHATANDQPLKATLEVIGTRYCYGDVEVFPIWLKLRVKYVNRTEKTVILDKEIGKAWYGVKVARNLESLAAGRYEYNPNLDWVFTDSDKLPAAPSFDSLGPDFAILTPGQMFVSEINTNVVAQYENSKHFAGAIRSGVHVFQMELNAWNHGGDGADFEKSWLKVGKLVRGVVSTEPLEIQVPADPKVEKNCK